ncbi:MAG TPA: zf-HC2 domain-containing protein [Acidobacteriaceae bacterium]
MSDHLTSALLNALADGELSGDQSAIVSEHLAGCPECTSRALEQSLLKSATAKAGERYTVSAEFQGRMERLISEAKSSRPVKSPSQPQRAWNESSLRWASLAAVLLVCVTIFGLQRWSSRTVSETTGLVLEVRDQHIATLAANAPPEVISSDRHTVKPWFQGKIPFSFNLPQNLPEDTTLDGANLTYLGGRPTAQLLYSVGKHRVSIFVRQEPTASGLPLRFPDQAGFHVTGFRAGGLEVVAVSDTEMGRLSDLVSRFEQAQAGGQGGAK